MNEEPRIEPAPMLTPPIPAPEMTPKRVVLPQSVVSAIKMRHEQLAEAELNAYQKLYEQGTYTHEEIRLLVAAGKITEPKNIFQIIQEQGMSKILEFALSCVKSNWRTTVAGVSVFAATTLANWGIHLPQSDVESIIGIGYVAIFGLSDFRWNLPTVLGVLLLVLSFFVNPILVGLGVAISPGTVLVVNQLIQAAISFLLKDQEQKFRNPLPAAILVAALFLAPSLSHAQDTPSKIPCGFDIYHTHITVKYDSAYCEKINAWGTYNHRQALIRLNNAQDTHTDRLHETFYHELTHCLLETVERRDLSRNERFVAVFSRALRQALASMQYDCPQALLTPQPRVYPD